MKSNIFESATKEEIFSIAFSFVFAPFREMWPQWQALRRECTLVAAATKAVKCISTLHLMKLFYIGKAKSEHLLLWFKNLQQLSSVLVG